MEENYKGSQEVLRDANGEVIFDLHGAPTYTKPKLTKHDAVKKFFEPIVRGLAGEMIGFNFSPESRDNIALITSYSDRVVQKYITGRALKEYAFSIIIVKAYSTEDDDLNIEAMNFAESFMTWLEEQNKVRNFPDFGVGCQIVEMENLQNMPNLSGINAEEGLARYMIQARIRYEERV